MKKIVAIMILLITIVINIPFAYATGDFSAGDAIGGAEDFISDGESQAASANVDDKIDDTIKGIVSAGLGIGTIVAICTGIVIAIKNMTDGAVGKKELKESLTPYIIACVLLFGAFTVWSAVVEIMENTFNSTPGTPVATPTPSPVPDPSTGSQVGGSTRWSSFTTILASYGLSQQSDGYYWVPVGDYNSPSGQIKNFVNETDMNGKTLKRQSGTYTKDDSAYIKLYLE
ncbi:MAG: hypothetical protein E7311_04760 [Clostridiales bacterium]|nr:hypothetical protein [Clostridiales bacterium]